MDNILKGESGNKLQCPMCGAADAFTPDAADQSKGYCSAEGKTYVLRR